MSQRNAVLDRRRQEVNFCVPFVLALKPNEDSINSYRPDKEAFMTSRKVKARRTLLDGGGQLEKTLVGGHRGREGGMVTAPSPGYGRSVGHSKLS